MDNTALQDYIFFGKYSRYNKKLGRKENFGESVDRIFDMHLNHLMKNYPHVLDDEAFMDEFDFAYEMSKKGIVFGSMRAFQFGGDPILKHNAKMYNCTFSYADRTDFFKELMYVLLCGCGAGFSVQNCHVDNLPTVVPFIMQSETFSVPDSIEGWSYAIDELVKSYFVTGKKVLFDYQYVRPKGSLIAGYFKAPGPEGLRDSIEKIRLILDSVRNDSKKLKPIEVFDICCHIADAVLSGGVRRSALICLFSMEDEEMMNAKTGMWFYDNPQRARSNNSCVFIRSEHTEKQYNDVFSKIKDFGEPGFVFLDDKDIGVNPCVEIGLYAKHFEIKESGWQFCNLCTVSGRLIKTAEDFSDACRAMAIIGTIQASYNKFEFLGKVTEEIVKRESLLGCSITGLMKNASILLDDNVLELGAASIVDTNKKLSAIIGIPQAARCTTIKPEGTSSALTGNTSGCHGDHSRRYLRRAQVNKEEDIYRIFNEINPSAIKDSVFSKGNTDAVISFPIEAGEVTVLKSELLGIKQLEVVKKLKEHWINPGRVVELCVKPTISHNVSNTITVDDWDKVQKFIWDNKETYTGISFLSDTGDTKYNQAPFAEVLMPRELLKIYGDGIMFASGLIVDILDTFGDLWKACDTAEGNGERLSVNNSDVLTYMSTNGIFLDPALKYVEYVSIKEGRKSKVYDLLVKFGQDKDLAMAISSGNDDLIIMNIIKNYLDNTLYCRINKLSEKREIIRRIKGFSIKYFKGDLDKTIKALKHMHLYHEWCTIKRECVNIDWEKQQWSDSLLDADTQTAVACHSGSCETI